MIGRPGKAATRQRYRVAAIEMAATVALIALYFLIRGAHLDDPGASVARALRIVELERDVGIFHERAWQQAVLDHRLLVDIAGFIYVWLEHPVIFGVGVWLALRDIDRFRFIRNVMLVSAVMGIIGYWTIPAAPPRLLAAYGYDLGFVDVIHEGTPGGVRDMQPGPLKNEYAALPSFHFAWIALITAAIWYGTRNWTMRAIGVALSAAMLWAVVVTGNHFFFDIILGLLVLAAAWYVTKALHWAWEAHPHRTLGAARWRVSTAAGNSRWATLVSRLWPRSGDRARTARQR